jgi:hypothetical protein
VSTLSSLENDDECPLEASSRAIEEEGSVGCVGFRQVFPQNTFEGPYKGQNREKPYTPYTSSTIANRVETSLEASGEPKKSEEKPYTDPTHSTSLPEEWEEFVL